MPNLTDATVVANESGMPVLLRKGDPLPEWAVGKVGPHLLDEDVEVDHDRAVPLPPKGGPGSGAEAWLTYARQFDDVDVDDDASREEIQAALGAADHPVD